MLVHTQCDNVSVLPAIYYKAVPMLDNCGAATAAGSVTPVLLDQSTNPDAVQSSHTAFDPVRY